MASERKNSSSTAVTDDLELDCGGPMEPMPQMIPSHVTAQYDLAREMNRLSFEERNKVLEDLHAVSDVTAEDPSRTNLFLSQMQEKISKIEPREAFDLALSIDPEYAQDKSLRLMFLRAEDFNVKLAAYKFIRFFEVKLALFGRKTLCKPIDLEDLSEDDMVCLRNGALQLFPCRDRAGRSVLIHMQPQNEYPCLENCVRSLLVKLQIVCVPLYSSLIQLPLRSVSFSISSCAPWMTKRLKSTD